MLTNDIIDWSYTISGNQGYTDFLIKKQKGKIFVFPFCGATRDRTKDTRIFSPLLYLLSYGTLLFWCDKSKQIFIPAKKKCFLILILMKKIKKTSPACVPSFFSYFCRS